MHNTIEGTQTHVNINTNMKKFGSSARGGEHEKEYVPPSTKDIADWSKSCIGILELSETMGATIDETLNTMKTDRERIRRRRDFILSKYQDTEVTLDKQLALLPTDINEYKKVLSKKKIYGSS